MEEIQPAVRRAERVHLLANIPVVVVFFMVLYQVVAGAGVGGPFNWLLCWLIALAAFSTLTALARQLQWQYVLTAAFICGLVGGLSHAFSLDSGIPFGPFVFGPEAGPQFFSKLPWTVPVIWLVVVFNSRGVGRLILRPWRKMRTYGFWLIGFTVVLSTLFDLAMDPFMGRWQHFWLWSPTKLPLTWEGAPLILAFATPVLIKKQPGQRNPSDYHPLVVWLGGLTIFAVAMGRQGIWGAVILDAVVAVAATVPAIRGGRW